MMIGLKCIFDFKKLEKIDWIFFSFIYSGYKLIRNMMFDFLMGWYWYNFKMVIKLILKLIIIIENGI